jgi:micrococcal nuclease
LRASSTATPNTTTPPTPTPTTTTTHPTPPPLTVRYLNVDTPESTGGKNDCYGVAAADENRRLVDGKAVELTYDADACTDQYGRTLAYVKVSGTDVNAHLVKEGFACQYPLPPAGEARIEEFATYEAEASTARKGMWGSCSTITCQH